MGARGYGLGSDVLSASPVRNAIHRAACPIFITRESREDQRDRIRSATRPGSPVPSLAPLSRESGNAGGDFHARHRSRGACSPACPEHRSKSASQHGGAWRYAALRSSRSCWATVARSTSSSPDSSSVSVSTRSRCSTRAMTSCGRTSRARHNSAKRDPARAPSIRKHPNRVIAHPAGPSPGGPKALPMRAVVPWR